MASESSICNLALSHLGVGKEIASLETERSAEASACRRFYDVVRDSTLRDFNWPFATRIEALALVEEDPNDEWSYSYRYPTNCLKVRRLLSGVRNDGPDTRVPYKIAGDDQGILLWADSEDAQMEFTARTEDPARYPEDFILAFSFNLAAHIAPRVTGGDPFKNGDRALKLYEAFISAAKATAANEQQDERVPESEFIRGRE